LAMADFLCATIVKAKGLGDATHDSTNYAFALGTAGLNADSHSGRMAARIVRGPVKLGVAAIGLLVQNIGL
jgi:hypothetical protein